MAEHSYTMRATWPDKPQPDNDYVFRVDGIDAGRCYLAVLTGGQQAWSWTIYGKSASGNEPTLGEAQWRFKEAFERLRAAGSIPRCSLASRNV